jgi:hypothetical protein
VLGEVGIARKAKISREGSVDAREQLQVVGDGARLSSGLETYCREKSAQIVGDTLIEAVKSTAFVLGEVAIAGERLEETGGDPQDGSKWRGSCGRKTRRMALDGAGNSPASFFWGEGCLGCGGMGSVG